MSAPTFDWLATCEKCGRLGVVVVVHERGVKVTCRWPACRTVTFWGWG